ncbi:bifunctional ADP-dependent NAD(P)H-hydrate dehydratase/NAD(P)H-hydrate epimerase, partial [Gammaproteobacteria bacterium]|nr:bifunctional ADP-dependent NAD(P)H-hydrate dehydratase/NAD(P)H-hydrate epimerase [Gammaproteobacteria bacterium]
PYGNPGMSAAGMGDVLSGVIGGLVAQGLDMNDAACLGAIVHSLAADNIAAGQGELGLLATQLLPEIRKLLNCMPG